MPRVLITHRTTYHGLSQVDSEVCGLSRVIIRTILVKGHTVEVHFLSLPSDPSKYKSNTLQTSSKVTEKAAKMADASFKSDVSLFKVNDIRYLKIIENTGSGHQVRNP